MGRIIGFARQGTGRRPTERARLDEAFAAAGIIPLEIIEEDAGRAATEGRYGLVRLNDLIVRSDVDAVVAVDLQSLGSKVLADTLKKRLALNGVRLLTLE